MVPLWGTGFCFSLVGRHDMNSLVAGFSPQDFPKQVPGHGNFGQLERDVPAMADNFAPDLD